MYTLTTLIAVSCISGIMGLLVGLCFRRTKPYDAVLKPDKVDEAAQWEKDAKAGEHGLGPFMARNGYPPTDESKPRKANSELEASGRKGLPPV